MFTLFMNAWSEVNSQNTEAKSDSQLDWEHLNYMKNFFCKAPEGCKEYDNLSMLEAMRYVDRLYTKRSRLAEAFLGNHLNSPHYDDALVLFFSSYFTPKFIPGSLASETVEAIKTRAIRGHSGAWAKAYRLMPIDKVSEKIWIEKGNELVANILSSNASVERKAKAEILLFNRDYSLAKNKFISLPKDSLEQDFWTSIEANYFEFMALRLERYMDDYPDSDTMAKYIQSVIDTMSALSPVLSNAFMIRFLRRSGPSNPMAKRKGVLALHESLLAKVEILETLDMDFKKPLELTFTSIDGSQVNLSDMRGKVVLINFWSSTCPACISAMPHLKFLYDKYRDKGFEIIGIADEGNSAKDHVQKILKKANANWPQCLDKGSEASIKFHTLYQIEVWPTFWLIDNKGYVVEQNVKIPQLESLIVKYIY